jgi:hypothetical protein
MKKLLSLLAIVLAIYAHGTQAAVVNASDINIQGGSNASIIWRAPADETYKVFVSVPSNATATHALYYVYPYGQSPTRSLCSSLDIDYPCFKIPVNQALQQGKWLQLIVNRDSGTAWRFIQNTGYVKVGASNLSATEKLAVGSVRFDPVYLNEYMAKWAKAIASVSALKLAISECINDHSGQLELCHTLDANTGLGAYGITSMPDFDGAGKSIVTLEAHTDASGHQVPAIQIAGDYQLGSCTFQMQPNLNYQTGTISWTMIATAAAKPNTTTDCAKLVKGSIVL